MTFGERLKKARIDSGISQAEAAESMEMSRPTLSAIEADKRQVLAEDIIDFSEIYHVPVSNLMSEKDNSDSDTRKRQSARLLQYTADFQKLSYKQQDRVLAYIKNLRDNS